MFPDGGAAAAAATPAPRLPRRARRCTRRRRSMTAISIAPRSAAGAKSPAEILAGAEDALARSAPLAGAAAVSHDVFKALDEKAAASVSAPAFESSYGSSFGQADRSDSAAR